MHLHRPAALISLATLAAITAPAGFASAETYRIVNNNNRGQFVLAECAQTPANRSLDWIRRNCTELGPQAAGTGPISDVLYSAAGNSGDAPSGGFMAIYGWSHEVKSPTDPK
jgi:hypothetical protein